VFLTRVSSPFLTRVSFLFLTRVSSPFSHPFSPELSADSAAAGGDDTRALAAMKARMEAERARMNRGRLSRRLSRQQSVDEERRRARQEEKVSLLHSIWRARSHRVYSFPGVYSFPHRVYSFRTGFIPFQVAFWFTPRLPYTPLLRQHTYGNIHKLKKQQTYLTETKTNIFN
jgi:hypothetical protein